jgi:hypothetical protein
MYYMKKSSFKRQNQWVNDSVGAQSLLEHGEI